MRSVIEEPIRLRYKEMCIYIYMILKLECPSLSRHPKMPSLRGSGCGECWYEHGRGISLGGILYAIRHQFTNYGAALGPLLPEPQGSVEFLNFCSYLAQRVHVGI